MGQLMIGIGKNEWGRRKYEEGECCGMKIGKDTTPRMGGNAGRRIVGIGMGQNGIRKSRRRPKEGAKVEEGRKSGCCKKGKCENGKIE
jgi:hypothetical protein